MLHSNGFLSQALPISPNWNASIEQPVEPSLVSPIPLLLFEASLPRLRVTLTYFTYSSYERVLRLPTSFPSLTLSPIMIWYSGLTALFDFYLERTAPASLPTALCGTEAIFSFSVGPVCSRFSAETCAILHALCLSRQHQQVCHFSSLLLLSDSRFVLTTLSSPPSFLLSQTLWQIWQGLSSLSSCFIRLQWIPRHLFLSRNDAADELARRGALLASSAISCSLCSLIFRIHSCLFSDWRRAILSKFFDKQVPSRSYMYSNARG